MSLAAMGIDTKQRGMQPLVAMRALRTLINDPDKTEQVFIIIRAMSGNALENCYRQFRETPVGKQVLAEQRQLIDLLQDRQFLGALPAGSLGRHYLSFVEKEEISAQGLVEASDDEIEIPDPGLLLYAERIRDMHDLWHVTTGYGRDTFGEACLLAFTYAQTRNRGIGTIALVGYFKLRKEIGPGVAAAMWQGYRAGRNAEWLPAQDWENLLRLPIDDVRKRLNIGEPVKYHEKHAQLALTRALA